MRAFSSARERARAAAAEELKQKNQRMLLYGSALAISTLALCYASVPLYKVFCQATGFGGTTRRAEQDTLELLKPAETSRVIRVTFDGSVSDSLPWSFVPAQRDVRVVPGESALAFYVTKNNSEKAITGVATYNVMPPQAGPYFVKIQCFCFDEQRLQAGEEVDMPPAPLDVEALRSQSGIEVGLRRCFTQVAERLVADLGDHDIMLLRNHGTLTVGKNVGEAFTYMYFLMKACQIQVRTLAMGPGHTPSQQALDTTAQQAQSLGAGHKLAWPALIRKLERMGSDYAT